MKIIKHFLSLNSDDVFCILHSYAMEQLNVSGDRYYYSAYEIFEEKNDEYGYDFTIYEIEEGDDLKDIDAIIDRDWAEGSNNFKLKDAKSMSQDESLN